MGPGAAFSRVPTGDLGLPASLSAASCLSFPFPLLFLAFVCPGLFFCCSRPCVCISALSLPGPTLGSPPLCPQPRHLSVPRDASMSPGHLPRFLFLLPTGPSTQQPEHGPNGPPCCTQRVPGNSPALLAPEPGGHAPRHPPRPPQASPPGLALTMASAHFRRVLALRPEPTGCSSTGECDRWGQPRGEPLGASPVPGFTPHAGLLAFLLWCPSLPQQDLPAPAPSRRSSTPSCLSPSVCSVFPSLLSPLFATLSPGPA